MYDIGMEELYEKKCFFSADSQKRKDVFKIVSGYKWGKDTAYRRCDLLFGQEKD